MVLPRLALAGREPPGVGAAALVVVVGRQLGRLFPIAQGRTAIGRNEENDICLADEGVSRRHAELVADGDLVAIRDLGSTSGTYVNSRRIDDVVLADGDFVAVGRTIFKCCLGDEIQLRYHEALHRLSTTDGLTGLYNARWFRDALEHRTAAARKAGRPLALVLVALDDFGAHGEEIGGRAADAILRKVAELVRESVGDDDVVARHGAHELAVCMPGVDLSRAAEVAADMRARIERTAFEPDAMHIAASIGVAALGESAGGASELLQLALARLGESRAPQ